MKCLWKSGIMLAGFLILIPFGWTQNHTLHMRQVKLSKVPAIGERIEAPNKPERTECMVNSARLDPCVEATIDGIKYTIAFRNSGGGDYYVTRVSTLDSKFKSPEGLHIGDKITVNGPEDIFEAPYFEVYAKKGNRWIPIIGMLGMVNLDFDGKKFTGDTVEKLWSVGSKPVQLVVTGFIEVEDKK
jgi:hypothetical protein